MKVNGQIEGIATADNMLHLNGTVQVAHPDSTEEKPLAPLVGRFRLVAPKTDENMDAFRVGQTISIDVTPR